MENRGGEVKWYNAFMIKWIVLYIFILFILWLMRGLRSSLQVTKYQLQVPDLPDALDGLKIAHVSDLHSCKPKGLIQNLQDYCPDLILATGDIFDGVHGAEDALAFLEIAAAIAPVYMVTGNHEKYLMTWPMWKEKVKQAGVHLLENEAEIFDVQGYYMEVAGVDDFGTTRRETKEQLHKQIQDSLAKTGDPKSWRILLFHRASLLDQIPENFAGLVCSGHLHGGQWRIFNKGICGPGDLHRLALFPAHSGGVYHNGKQLQVVSRGLGDRMKIPRFNNRPELVLIELEQKPDESPADQNKANE